MIIKVALEEETIFLNYLANNENIKEKLEYSYIERLIDFLMENNIDDISVEDNSDCSQYVDLLKNILTKIAEGDFKKCYQETKNITSQQEVPSPITEPNEEIPL